LIARFQQPAISPDRFAMNAQLPGDPPVRPATRP